MFKNIVIALTVLVIAGCESMPMTNTDPFSFSYEPIASKASSSSDVYLNITTEILEQSGYSVTPNHFFYTATTLPMSLGKLRWRKNGDKWDVKYQLGVQILKRGDEQLFWRLTHKIVGSRSGKEPRNFQPSDFDKTEELFNDAHRNISIAFSKEA